MLLLKILVVRFLIQQLCYLYVQMLLIVWNMHFALSKGSVCLPITKKDCHYDSGRSRHI